MTPYDIKTDEFYELYKEQGSNYTLELEGVLWTFHDTSSSGERGWNRVDIVLNIWGDKLNGVV